MLTIWKFPISIEDIERIQMPQGAKVLSVQVRETHGTCLWALVDTLAPMVDRTFHVRGTGHPMRDAAGAAYIGTVQVMSGVVFHVFDAGES